MRHVCTSVALKNNDGKLRHCTIHTSHRDNKFETPLWYPILYLTQNKRCVIIAFSGYENAEN